MPNLIIIILATWRITSLLVNEAGPFEMFRRLREKAGIIHDQNGIVIGDDTGFFAGLLSCFWCTSIWTAAILSAILSAVFVDLSAWLPLTLCASAGAIIIEEKI